MHVQSFRVSNFRRLRDVTVDLDAGTTIFVGANNSGKTSATHVFQLFLGDSKGSFSIYDFSLECWNDLNSAGDSRSVDCLPKIDLDLWLEVDDENVHRVADFLPSLEWARDPVGIRLSFQVKNPESLMQGYVDALEKASETVGQTDSKYEPWPINLTDYLKKRLMVEYEIFYHVLFRDGEAPDGQPIYASHPLGNAASGASRLIDSLIRVDFLDAQKNLSDGESRGRHENLSRRLSRYYTRNLTKQDADLNALSALTESEEKLNAHFRDAFSTVMNSLSKFGYPGVGNYNLVVKADFNPSSILSNNANVHYALPTSACTVGRAATLPDRYNGLGFKNLIYMAVEVLDFHHAWSETEADRPPIHLLMIEEPESHLHAQLQQVFIRQIMELVRDEEEGFHTQMVITTHSSHIIYENSFQSIRYFRRMTNPEGVSSSDVRNLSKFYEAEDKHIRNFLVQYLKLTHCDLFFADGVILVEGNVERLLVPLMITKGYPALESSHLTVLEVGGAFAHKFDKLIEFLDVPTLVITDIDSVHSANKDVPNDQTAEETENITFEEEVGNPKKCMANTPGALTANETLKQWVPKLCKIDELIKLPARGKIAKDLQGKERRVRVAYQTLVDVSWQETDHRVVGRTLEETFALENLEWCQEKARAHLGLRIANYESLSWKILHEKLYKRVAGFDKTRFALGLIAESLDEWQTPIYIQQGLAWLEDLIVSDSLNGACSKDSISVEGVS